MDRLTTVSELQPAQAHRSRNGRNGKPKIKRASHEIRIGFGKKALITFSQAQSLRLLVQWGFLLFVVWIGYDFIRFVRWAESGDLANPVGRPPGVEAFLPLSALISLKYWIYTGIINNIHPAGMVILLAVIGMSILVRKSFCSWVCPVGYLSESFATVGERIFGRNFRLPRWLDYPLRSLKYLLLLFFAWSIFAGMGHKAVEAFIYSPYNRVADIKMLKFFQNLDATAAWTLITLAVLSIFVKHFWCRYLCPYGALLGILGFLAPVKVTRNLPTCTDCGLCTKVCPANIKVHKAKRVLSDECTSCLTCIDACPVADTLYLGLPGKSKRKVSPLLAAVAIVLMLPLAAFIANLAGHWQNGISPREYVIRVHELDSPIYMHNRGKVAAEPDPGRFK